MSKKPSQVARRLIVGAIILLVLGALPFGPFGLMAVMFLFIGVAAGSKGAVATLGGVIAVAFIGAIAWRSRNVDLAILFASLVVFGVVVAYVKGWELINCKVNY